MLKEQMNYDLRDCDGVGSVVFDHILKISKQVDSILIYTQSKYEHLRKSHLIQKYILSEFADQANISDDDILRLSKKVANADSK